MADHPLKPFVPPQALNILVPMLEAYPLRFVIERTRRSKWGDYRPAVGGARHRISVNGSLNAYAFLLTAVHEYAHLLVHVRYPGKRLPAHGQEWKACFREALAPFQQANCFPDDISSVLAQHMRNPRASVTADIRLQEALMRYDRLPDGSALLRDLPEGSFFRGPDGRLFKRGRMLRKRILCHCMDDGRDYRVYALLQVKGVSDTHL